jgi:hypothetical protein
MCLAVFITLTIITGSMVSYLQFHITLLTATAVHCVPGRRSIRHCLDPAQGAVWSAFWWLRIIKCEHRQCSGRARRAINPTCYDLCPYVILIPGPFTSRCEYAPARTGVNGFLSRFLSRQAFSIMLVMPPHGCQIAIQSVNDCSCAVEVRISNSRPARRRGCCLPFFDK